MGVVRGRCLGPRLFVVSVEVSHGHRTHIITACLFPSPHHSRLLPSSPFPSFLHHGQRWRRRRPSRLYLFDERNTPFPIIHTPHTRARQAVAHQATFFFASNHRTFYTNLFRNRPVCTFIPRIFGFPRTSGHCTHAMDIYTTTFTYPRVSATPHLSAVSLAAHSDPYSLGGYNHGVSNALDSRLPGHQVDAETVQKLALKVSHLHGCIVTPSISTHSKGWNFHISGTYQQVVLARGSILRMPQSSKPFSPVAAGRLC